MKRTVVAGLVGTEAGSDGIPLLFVHGNACDRGHFAAEQRRLGARRSLAFDLRGLGESPFREPNNFAAAAGDLEAVLDELALPRVILVGHSFGGAVVGELAARRPERVEALVFVDAAGTQRIAPEAARAFLAQFESEEFREHWLAGPLSGARPETRAIVLDGLRRSRREVVRDNLASILEFDPTRTFAAYRGPTHAIVAESMLGSPSLVAEFPSLPRTVLTGVSHWLMLDDPAAFGAALDSVLRPSLRR